MNAIPEIIENTSLVYVSPSDPGIKRKGNLGKFWYENEKGDKIINEQVLERISKIVIPPAWTDVWIAAKSNAYLQAVGIDAAGRKQYKYHIQWTNRRAEHKYFKLLEFGKTLKKARTIINRDLRRKKYNLQKVLAICLDLMQKTFIRIGNEQYKELYGSYGLTTLRNKHIQINGSSFSLAFVGKKGVVQRITYSDRKLAELLKRCKEIPGQELFQYINNDGERCTIGTTQINNYIRTITGGEFTAKDFRTWGGTVEALRQMAICEQEFPDLPRKKLVVRVLDNVAERLGNTRAVCKSAYVYPALLTAFEENKLSKYLREVNINANQYSSNEKVLMLFLKDSIKKST